MWRDVFCSPTLENRRTKNVERRKMKGFRKVSCEGVFFENLNSFDSCISPYFSRPVSTRRQSINVLDSLYNPSRSSLIARSLASNFNNSFNSDPSLDSDTPLDLLYTMASRSMMRSVSASASEIPPPASVSLIFQSTPFKPSSTRRDLSTSYRAFKASWAAIEQVQVLSTSCRRLGERAAEVLNAVREKLESIDQEEKEKLNGKVVLEKAYEFQKGKEGEDSAGKTIFKIQSYIS